MSGNKGQVLMPIIICFVTSAGRHNTSQQCSNLVYGVLKMGMQYSKPNKQDVSTKIENLGQFFYFWQILHFAICCETIETKPQLNALFVSNSENTYFSFDLLDLVDSSAIVRYYIYFKQTQTVDKTCYFQQQLIKQLLVTALLQMQRPKTRFVLFL